MPDDATPFPLPANAPPACPGCGGPWTHGYVVRKMAGQPGSRAKKVYKWALECRNDGCGLGYFVGSEITHAETEGLKLIDRTAEKKKLLSTKGEAVPEDSPRTVAWSRHYDQCRDCGTTDRKHKSHGLCAKCYTDHKRAGTLDQFRTEKTIKTGGSRKKSVRAKAKDDGDLVEVNFVVKLRDLSPELQAEIKAQVAEKLADRVLAGLGGR